MAVFWDPFELLLLVCLLSYQPADCTLIESVDGTVSVDSRSGDLNARHGGRLRLPEAAPGLGGGAEPGGSGIVRQRSYGYSSRQSRYNRSACILCRTSPSVSSPLILNRAGSFSTSLYVVPGHMSFRVFTGFLSSPAASHAACLLLSSRTHIEYHLLESTCTRLFETCARVGKVCKRAQWRISCLTSLLRRI